MFFLGFRTWKVFRRLFHFSVCMSCLFPGRPVIFTSCPLYFTHVECRAPTWILLLFGNKKSWYFSRPVFPAFIVLTNHSNADKIVCILLPDCQSYFDFLHPLWVFLNSQRIRIDPQICSTQSKTTQILYPQQRKKILRLILNNRSNANNLF